MCSPDYDLITGDGRTGRERVESRETERQIGREDSQENQEQYQDQQAVGCLREITEKNRGTHTAHRHTDTQRKLTRQTKTGRGIAFGDNGKD